MQAEIFDSLQEQKSGKDKKEEQYFIFDQVHMLFSNNLAIEKSDEGYSYFNIENHLVHEGFADDFGPLNLSSVFTFCRALDVRIDHHPERKLVLHNEPTVRKITDAVFLVGA